MLCWFYWDTQITMAVQSPHTFAQLLADAMARVDKKHALMEAQNKIMRRQLRKTLAKRAQGSGQGSQGHAGLAPASDHWPESSACLAEVCHVMDTLYKQCCSQTTLL